MRLPVSKPFEPLHEYKGLNAIAQRAKTGLHSARNKGPTVSIQKRAHIQRIA